MWALQAHWHPSTPSHTKSKWADLYGVSKQLLLKYELKEGMGVLEERFRAGLEPPPPAPQQAAPAMSPLPQAADERADAPQAASPISFPAEAASSSTLVDDSAETTSSSTLVHGVDVAALLHS